MPFYVVPLGWPLTGRIDKLRELNLVEDAPAIELCDPFETGKVLAAAYNVGADEDRYDGPREDIVLITDQLKLNWQLQHGKRCRWVLIDSQFARQHCPLYDLWYMGRGRRDFGHEK